MRHDLPVGEGYFIDVPDRWLGMHGRRRDETLAKSSDLPETWRNFAVAMALLDDWFLPGLPKNPDGWELDKIELPLMIWVTHHVLTSYNKCYEVSKNSWPLSSNLSPATAAEPEAGNGEKTAS
jgi:hypothetical protein